MDLGNPGADLLGSNETAVLRVLAHRTDALSGREVARLAGASPSSIRRALDRLVTVGLVAVAAQSHALLYSANRDHVLWTSVHGILDARSVVERAIGELVRVRLGELGTVAVFGSVARGDATAGSDVDVVLVVADEVVDEVRMSVADDLVDLVESRTGNPAQVVTVGREQLRDMTRAKDPLVSSWVADAVDLAGPTLASLIAST